MFQRVSESEGCYTKYNGEKTEIITFTTYWADLCLSLGDDVSSISADGDSSFQFCHDDLQQREKEGKKKKKKSGETQQRTTMKT